MPSTKKFLPALTAFAREPGVILLVAICLAIVAVLVWAATHIHLQTPEETRAQAIAAAEQQAATKVQQRFTRYASNTGVCAKSARSQGGLKPVSGRRWAMKTSAQSGTVPTTATSPLRLSRVSRAKLSVSFSITGFTERALPAHHAAAMSREMSRTGK